jgi:WD40 repeat protein
MKHLVLTILFTFSLFAQEIGVPYAILNGSKVTALASTKDGKTIFSATAGSVLYRIELDPIKVIYFASIGKDVKRWTAYSPNGKPYQAFSSKPTTTNHIAISPDEKFIVTCSTDKLLKAWDTQSGKLLQTFTGHESSVKSAVILSDNKTLISGDENMTIKYWDIPSGKEMKSFAVNAKAGEFNNDPEILHNLYLSSNGKILVVYDSYRVGFVDVDTGKVMKEYRHKGDFWANASYFYNDVLYVLRDMYVLEYDVGKFSQLMNPSFQDIITINPKKNFKREQEGAILNSCITDANDILTILIHIHASLTSAPLVIDKLKVYGGKSGEMIIDQCPMDTKIIINPIGHSWLAITTDGYFNTSIDSVDSVLNARDDLYIKNNLGKAIPIDDATYNKYHKTLTVEEK